MPLMIGDPPGTQWLRQQNRNIRRVSDEEPPESDLPPNVTRFIPRNPMRPPKPEEEAKNPMPPVNAPGLPKTTEALEGLGQSVSRLGPALRALKEAIRNGTLGQPTNVRSLDAARAQRDPANIQRQKDAKIDAALQWQKTQRRMADIEKITRNKQPTEQSYDPQEVEPPQWAGSDPAEFGKNQYTISPNLGTPNTDRWWVLHSPSFSDSWNTISAFDNQEAAWNHVTTLLNPGPRPVP